MNQNTTMLSFIAIALLLFTIAAFALEASTTVRWQERAIDNYNTAVRQHTKPSHIPEPWWTDNPFQVAYGVWKKDPYNWLSLIVSILSYVFILLRRYEEEKSSEKGAL